jgi:acetyl/propionyl-CoA carboxylase alpha subunit
MVRPLGASEPVEVALQRTDARHVESYNVVAGARHADVEIEMIAPGHGWLRLGGRIVPFRAVRKKSTLSLWLGGGSFIFEFVERTARRKGGLAAAAKRAELSAPMPGTILKVNVGPGDAFEAHGALIVMESMKMELTLSAPHGGSVKEIKCRPGQLVEMGAVLITFNEESNAGPA